MESALNLDKGYFDSDRKEKNTTGLELHANFDLSDLVDALARGSSPQRKAVLAVLEAIAYTEDRKELMLALRNIIFFIQRTREFENTQ